MPEYVVIARDPKRVAIGDHIIETRETAIEFAAHCLDTEEWTGAFVTITVVSPNTDEDLVPTLATTSSDANGHCRDHKQGL